MALNAALRVMLKAALRVMLKAALQFGDITPWWAEIHPASWGGLRTSLALGSLVAASIAVETLDDLLLVGDLGVESHLSLFALHLYFGHANLAR